VEERDDQAGRLPDDLERLFEAAVELSGNAELHAVLARAGGDRELRARLDRGEAVNELGLDLPNGLDLRFFERRAVLKPVPDIDRFSIRLFNCRTYWVKKDDGPGYEEVEICFGFEISQGGVRPIG
jgi:hypothetical protein